MTLGAGTSIGPYEIVELIGRGGMGEVYRARDSKLRRDVAIKILPASFAEGPDRVRRFEREAQLLASLSAAADACAAVGAGEIVRRAMESSEANALAPTQLPS